MPVDCLSGPQSAIAACRGARCREAQMTALEVRVGARAHVTLRPSADRSARGSRRRRHVTSEQGNDACGRALRRAIDAHLAVTGWTRASAPCSTGRESSSRSPDGSATAPRSSRRSWGAWRSRWQRHVHMARGTSRSVGALPPRARADRGCRHAPTPLRPGERRAQQRSHAHPIAHRPEANSLGARALLTVGGWTSPGRLDFPERLDS